MLSIDLLKSWTVSVEMMLDDELLKPTELHEGLQQRTTAPPHRAIPTSMLMKNIKTSRAVENGSSGELCGVTM